jgi:predicted AlkP superfamily pyrophosphatase or phosphodiesterase
MRCALFVSSALLCSVALIGPLEAEPKAVGRPKLVVLLVFDQMRGDYLSRWYDLYPKGGIRRLAGDGAWFVDCNYPYANTMTGPGHATLATGCPPRKHGIVGNDWLDIRTGKTVNCVGVGRYTPIPPPPVDPNVKKKSRSVSPELLLSPTIADAIKKHFGTESRVVALSLKDRSSVLPGGRSPDACYWIDATGRFVTSTYYRDRVHPWVADFNKGAFGDRWLGKTWDRLRADVDYEKWSGPDDVPGEGKGSAQGRTFPHPFDGGEKKSMEVYHKAVANSPMGNVLLWELAKKAIEAEKLGTRSTPDFLSVSFSSNDSVGHTWGPDSQEVLDTTLRSDILIKDILATLDAKVGKGKYVVVLSADHGVCPLPEVSRGRKIDAGRLDYGLLLTAAEEYLDETFPDAKVKAKDENRWIQAAMSNMLYLDRKKLKRRGVEQAVVAKALAGWLKKQTGILAAYTRADMAIDAPPDEMRRKVKASYYAERSGDVMVVLKPYWLPGNYLTGTTHGTPHRYDTHVPLVVFGANVKPGKRKEPVSPEHAAAILAAALGIDPPSDATKKVPAGLFAGK